LGWPRRATIVVMSSAALAFSACESIRTTPAQEVALAHWRECQVHFPSARLNNVAVDGKISFSYSHAADLKGMNECLQLLAARSASAPGTARESGPGPTPPPPPSVVPPKLAYTYHIVDDRSAGATGNGDGRIQRGESVVLALLLKNVSSTAVDQVAVDIAARGGGVTLRSPRIDVGSLAAGETRPGSVRLDLAPSFGGSDLTLHLSVRGGDVILLEDDLRFVVDPGPPGPVRSISKNVVIDGLSAPIRSGAGAEMPTIAVANRAQPLTVTGEIGDWYRVRLSDADTGWILKREVTESVHAAPAGAPTVRPPAVIGVFQNAPPVIALASPADGQQINADRVQLIGGVGSANGIVSVEVTVNGQRVAVRDARGVAVKPTASAASASIEFSERVPLAEGRNEIVVTAVDAQNLTASRKVTITRLTVYGQIHAVVIGISRYVHVPSLRFADRDAIAVAEYLEKQVGVPHGNVTLITNEQATLVNLKRVLGTELKRRAGEKDTVIIFYAGHGAPEADASNPDDDGLEKYLVPHDGDPRDLYTTALPMREIENILQRLSAERVVFITDACYSGATGGRTFATASRRAIVSDNFLARLSRGKGRVVLTASRGNELSEERDELKHGVFTYYLLEGLRGSADLDGDGVITVDEVYAYVSLKVASATGQNQHPMKKGEVEGQLILGRTR
jgi:uncharacterized protein YgiM (DUF1202 family)